MSRIRDIANLFSGSTDAATDAEVSAAVSAHNSTTTSVHGITDTSVLATATSLSSAISTHATAANGHSGRGNTASRPASPTAGDMYANTQTGFVEIYTGATYGWEQVGGISSTVTEVTALEAVQPFASVIDTLYDVVLVGVTVIPAVVAPVLHR